MKTPGQTETLNIEISLVCIFVTSGLDSYRYANQSPGNYTQVDYSLIVAFPSYLGTNSLRYKQRRNEKKK